MAAKWQKLLSNTPAWWLEHAGRIGLTLVGIWVALRAMRALIAILNKQISERPDAVQSEVKQARTVTTIVEATGRAFIIFFGVLLVAAELGFNPTALLASAGFVGVAIGLGAQSLVKDALAGGFILFENQFGVGDWIRSGTNFGEVEVMTLRTTCLRELDGAFVIIPNGELGRVTNYGKKWANAIVDVAVPDTDDLDDTLAFIHETVHQLAAEWPDRILGKPEIVGVEALADANATVRLSVRTEALKQWEVARELRLRVKRGMLERRRARTAHAAE